MGIVYEKMTGWVKKAADAFIGISGALLFGVMALKIWEELLYAFEAGHISYHRTDAVALSQDAVALARLWIGKHLPGSLPEQPPVFRSKDLKHWTLIGDFLCGDLPDVAQGEDVSCPNFFPIGNKWMLLCISHNLGCRYYIGDWDAEAEQFVPQKHGRMNWRRDEQSLFGPPAPGPRLEFQARGDQATQTASQDRSPLKMGSPNMALWLS